MGEASKPTISILLIRTHFVSVHVAPFLRPLLMRTDDDLTRQKAATTVEGGV